MTDDLKAVLRAWQRSASTRSKGFAMELTAEIEATEREAHMTEDKLIARVLFQVAAAYDASRDEADCGFAAQLRAAAAALDAGADHFRDPTKKEARDETDVSAQRAALKVEMEQRDAILLGGIGLALGNAMLRLSDIDTAFDAFRAFHRELTKLHSEYAASSRAAALSKPDPCGYSGCPQVWPCTEPDYCYCRLWQPQDGDVPPHRWREDEVPLPMGGQHTVPAQPAREGGEIALELRLDALANKLDYEGQQIWPQDVATVRAAATALRNRAGQQQPEGVWLTRDEADELWARLDVICRTAMGCHHLIARLRPTPEKEAGE